MLSALDLFRAAASGGGLRPDLVAPVGRHDRHVQGLVPIFLVKGDRSTVADGGFGAFGNGCGFPLGNHGVVYSSEFEIPF